MESIDIIQKAVEESLERKFYEAVSREMKYPVPLVEYLLINRKKIKIFIEIYEDVILAYLADDMDIFAEGETVKKARLNLQKSLLDEYQFLINHENELSEAMKRKLSTLKGIVA